MNPIRPRPFLLSFLLTASLAVPLVLSATSELAPEPSLAFGPGLLAPTAAVDGATFQTTMTERGPGYATVRLVGSNPGNKTVTTTLRVAIVREAPMERMARVMPTPETVASREVAVTLAPGERYEQVLSFQNSRIPAAPDNGRGSASAQLEAGPGVSVAVSVAPGASLASAR